MIDKIPEIRILQQKMLIGKRLQMSLSDNKTGNLWTDFMQNRSQIRNIVGTDKYSIQNYGPDYFSHFNADKTFEKWAAVEVHSVESIPDGFEKFTLLSGKYAVFNYKGSNENAATAFRHIFEDWFPKSGFLPDNRPHFEILGNRYKNADPSSEEEIWIPVKSEQI